MKKLQTITDVTKYNSLAMRLFGNEEANSVSLREVYLDLGFSEGNFTTWAKKNLLPSFDENEDYVKVLFLEKRDSEQAKEQTDYIVTLDAAKEIAIVSGKPKGRRICKYLIAVEKQARIEAKLTPMQHMQIANEMLQEDNIRKEREIARNKKLIETLDIIEASAYPTGTTIQVEEFCKIVSDTVEGSDLGRTKAYIILRSLKFVMIKSTHPTQLGISRGYLNYVKHDYGYMTVVYTEKANSLIKMMAKHLQDNPMLDEALVFPFSPELRD